MLLWCWLQCCSHSGTLLSVAWLLPSNGLYAWGTKLQLGAVLHSCTRDCGDHVSHLWQRSNLSALGYTASCLMPVSWVIWVPVCCQFAGRRHMENLGPALTLVRDTRMVLAQSPTTPTPTCGWLTLLRTRAETQATFLCRLYASRWRNFSNGRVGSLESMRASHAGVVIRAGSDRSNGVVAGGDGTEI